MSYGHYRANSRIISYDYFLNYPRRMEQKKFWEEFKRLSDEIIQQQEEEKQNKQQRSVLKIVYSKNPRKEKPGNIPLLRQIKDFLY
jgi:hypothetical protein